MSKRQLSGQKAAQRATVMPLCPGNGWVFSSVLCGCCRKQCMGPDTEKHSLGTESIWAFPILPQRPWAVSCLSLFLECQAHCFTLTA